ncbi:MAG: sigma-70 family RNA polymerase sigma factor [Solobacterium sp.]|nr:sigma-70 family RNA polymerase sigma factor [Erysipelotrichaceae bacterium]MBQ9152613.1 sigma-70 family RNA polymerase sigma factor [Solobacterium sp.]
MEDSEIVALYWKRAEQAILETMNKYGRYLKSIAYRILFNDADSEECVNDTYRNAWTAMPPHKPEKLGPFLGKITRNIALNMYERMTAEKRGAGEMPAALDELSEIIGSGESVEATVDAYLLSDLINEFLKGLNSETRKIFVRRYWYMSPVKEIADEYGMSESKVKMSLLRTREKLRDYLQKEGYAV